MIKYYLTLKSNDFHIINAKVNERLVEDLLLKLKHNNHKDKVNDIFIHIIQVILLQNYKSYKKL